MSQPPDPHPPLPSSTRPPPSPTSTTFLSALSSPSPPPSPSTHLSSLLTHIATEKASLTNSLNDAIALSEECSQFPPLRFRVECLVERIRGLLLEMERWRVRVVVERRESWRRGGSGGVGVGGRGRRVRFDLEGGSGGDGEERDEGVAREEEDGGDESFVMARTWTEEADAGNEGAGRTPYRQRDTSTRVDGSLDFSVTSRLNLSGHKDVNDIPPRRNIRRYKDSLSFGTLDGLSTQGRQIKTEQPDLTDPYNLAMKPPIRYTSRVKDFLSSVFDGQVHERIYIKEEQGTEDSSRMDGQLHQGETHQSACHDDVSFSSTFNGDDTVEHISYTSAYDRAYIQSEGDIRNDSLMSDEGQGANRRLDEGFNSDFDTVAQETSNELGGDVYIKPESNVKDIEDDTFSSAFESQVEDASNISSHSGAYLKRKTSPEARPDLDESDLYTPRGRRTHRFDHTFSPESSFDPILTDTPLQMEPHNDDDISNYKEIDDTPRSQYATLFNRSTSASVQASSYRNIFSNCVTKRVPIKKAHIVGGDTEVDAPKAYTAPGRRIHSFDRRFSSEPDFDMLLVEEGIEKETEKEEDTSKYNFTDETSKQHHATPYNKTFRSSFTYAAHPSSSATSTPLHPILTKAPIKKERTTEASSTFDESNLPTPRKRPSHHFTNTPSDLPHPPDAKRIKTENPARNQHLQDTPNNHHFDETFSSVFEEVVKENDSLVYGGSYIKTRVGDGNDGRSVDVKKEEVRRETEASFSDAWWSF